MFIFFSFQIEDHLRSTKALQTSLSFCKKEIAVIASHVFQKLYLISLVTQRLITAWPVELLEWNLSSLNEIIIGHKVFDLYQSVFKLSTANSNALGHKNSDYLYSTNSQ